MQQEFIPYSQAVALQELGFKSTCFGWYGPITKYGDKHKLNIEPSMYNLLKDNGGRVDAPLYQQAFDWFRDEHSLLHVISPGLLCTISFLNEFETLSTLGGATKIFNHTHVDNGDETYFLDYRAAQLACLCKLIAIVESRNRKLKKVTHEYNWFEELPEKAWKDIEKLNSKEIMLLIKDLNKQMVNSIHSLDGG